MFAFRLALALGCTVKELLASMSKEEFFEWIAYYKIEPWGSVVDGYRNASVASTTANVALATLNPKRLRQKPYKISDFLIGVNESSNKPANTADAIKEALMSISKNRRG